MHPALESTIARNVPGSSSPPIVGSGLSRCENHSNDGHHVTFKRSECDVRCLDATYPHAALAPRCWWEMRDIVTCAFRFCRCVGSLHAVGSIALSKSRRLSSNASSSKCRRSITSLQYATPHLCFRAHTGARNSHNRARMSSTSRYSPGDPRGARAAAKLGVVGPELDDGSTSNSLPQRCELLQPYPERSLYNIQRHAAIALGHSVQPSAASNQ